MPAKDLEVWGGTSAANLVLLKRFNPAQPDSTREAYLTSFECKFPGKEVKVLKVVAKPVMKLPSWHPGKGQTAWVFLDEIFLN